MTDSKDPIRARFGDGPALTADTAPLAGMLTRGSCRKFTDERIPDDTLQSLAAAALSTPTKSDLQQRDILFVEDAALRKWMDGLFPDMPWIADAPHFLLFLANNRRQRQVHEWRGRDFANDHLDAFFNASVDAAVALTGFTLAAEILEYGSCPISAVRNHAAAISDRIGLPEHVFPICGLALGRPASTPPVSPRLPLSHTLHRDRFTEDGIRDAVDAYDHRRNETHPFRTQRLADRFGETQPYTWSEDKARQYAVPERADFGQFVRNKGFDLR